ncbi:hypothetical protein OUZ56_029899 [Daphnia magna]|uniref:Secreted protein n=1 Tax=Daphnia magna TaxID=35525 RepID=A0ABR0B851_9CRUS|nr:hypothetical protein OUZ56_029899 [Daphnia magna]
MAGSSLGVDAWMILAIWMARCSAADGGWRQWQQGGRDSKAANTAKTARRRTTSKRKTATIKKD